MVPLPFKAEQFLSLELQRVATRISCWMLQFLGLPALAQGNVIHIGDVPLTVAEACSGLRIFVSIVALAFAYSVLVRRPWWIKALLFASVVPIALIANAVRVTLIGVLYTVIESEEGRQRSHDVAGLLVIPLAAALMGLFLWYLGKLIVEVRVVSQKELLRTT
jgi:exosortase